MYDGCVTSVHHKLAVVLILASKGNRAEIWVHGNDRYVESHCSIFVEEVHWKAVESLQRWHSVRDHAEYGV